MDTPEAKRVTPKMTLLASPNPCCPPNPMKRERPELKGVKETPGEMQIL